MRRSIIYTVAAFSLVLFGSRLDANAATVGLDQYNCEMFLGDIVNAEAGERLLRSMMMISWALGYTSGIQKSPRGDTGSLGLVANVVGAACRNTPKELVINVVSRAIGELAAGSELQRVAKPLPTLPAGQSRWSQDGSIVDLSADGAARKFIMEVPQPEHAKVGASKGAVLFNGTKNANRYEGKAYKYAANCKATAYDVVGEISADEKQVTLRGQAPQIDARCKVIGHSNTSMVFTFIPPDAN